MQEILKIKFLVDENEIARQAISLSCMPVEFADNLWDNYNAQYRVAQTEASETPADILEIIKKQDFFKEYIKDAKNNCKLINNLFSRNKEKIEEFLRQKIKFNLKTKEVTGYILPKYFNTGYTQRDGSNSFVYGYECAKENKYADIIYIIHEFLHSILGHSKREHTIIEKISDVELAKYFEGKPYEGHLNLFEFHYKLFPYWNLFMKRTALEIEKEQKLCNIYYDINKYEKYRNKLEKMELSELVDFVKQLDLSDIKIEKKITLL